MSEMFLCFLTVLFVILKVWNLINWSWWMVFSPLWIPGAIVLIGILSAVLIVIITSNGRR